MEKLEHFFKVPKQKTKDQQPRQQSKYFYEIQFGKFITKDIFSYRINRDVFEKMLYSIKMDEKYNEVKNSEYALYYHKDMIYNIYRDGSSFGYRKKMTSHSDNAGWRAAVYEFRNFQNDEFPSLMKYDKIEDIEAIIFLFNGLNIEFLQKKCLLEIYNENERHYEIRISMAPDKNDYKLARTFIKLYNSFVSEE